MGYILVFCWGATVALLGVTHIDRTFESQKEDVDASIKICEALDSKPVSLDQYSVTCENGMEVSFE